MVADRSHPGTFIFDRTRFLATLLPFIDVVLVTAIFMSRKTTVNGYLLNGLIAIYGTGFMAHFSISEMMAKSVPLSSMLLKSTFADICVAWGDFFVGKALYDLYMRDTS